MREISQQIIALLAKSPRPITSAQLADSLGVSVRTIMSYVKKIHDTCPGLLTASHQGYRLAFNCGHNALAEEDNFVLPEDRLENLLLHLLMQEPQIAELQELADMAMVSYESIRRDTVLLKPRLKRHGLVLQQYRNELTIEGPEQKKRNLLSYLIYRQERLGRPTLQKLQQLFPDIPVARIQQSLFVLCQEKGYFINEVLWPTLMRDLLVMIHRFSRGCILLKNDIDVIPQHPAVSEAACLLLEKLCRLSLPSTERLYLQQLFSCFLLPYDLLDLPFPQLISQLSPTTGQLLPQLFDHLQQDLPFFPMDETFKVRLSLNIDSLLQRHKLGCLSTNPQKEELKQTSPFGVECTRYIMRRLTELTNHHFSEDDATYIAVHVVMALERVRQNEHLSCGLLVPRYFDYHQSLRHSIQQHFAQELQIDAISERTTDTARLLPTDIVLAVTPPPANFPIAWVSIPPVLRQERIQEIRLHIDRVRQDKQEAKLKKLLLSLGDEECFCRLPSGRDNTPNKLFALLQSLLGNNEEVPYHQEPAIYQHLAILDFSWHAEGQSRMAAVIPARPLKWQGKTLDILLAFSLRTTDWQDMVFLLDKLVQRLLDLKVRKSMRKAESFAQLMNCVLKEST